MYALFLKRAFDIVAGLILFIITLPLLLLGIALACIDGHQNPFFLQKRIGLHCKEFTIYKLRTMKAAPETDTPVHFKPGARELTRISQFLRLGIDELPQLLNIIKGDMSLIGPRPHALEYAAHYAAIHPGYYERYAVRPGLACIVEVSALHYMTEKSKHIRMRVECDLYYVQHASLLMDYRIFFKMVKYILSSLVVYGKRTRSSLVHAIAQHLHPEPAIQDGAQARAMPPVIPYHGVNGRFS